MFDRLFLGIAIAGVSTAAFAADFPVKAPPPPPAPPLYNWNGCYVGGNTGGKWWAHTSGTVNIAPGIDAVTSTTSFDFNANSGSFIGGGQVGCNYQVGQFVFGIEGDADWQHLSRTGTLFETSGQPGLTTNGSFSLKSDWEASLRGRFGYAADRVLWYATGGVAWTQVSLSGNQRFTSTTPCELVFPVSLPPFCAAGTGPGFSTTTSFGIIPVSKTPVGATVGAGFEFAITDQLTLGLEGRYTWYGSQHFNTSTTDPLVVVGSLNLNTAEFIGKLNWKFGGNEERRERPESGKQE
jgi:outer membrane immunogenic protein